MSNYLKLSKSYVSNDFLKNPNLNMLGPDLVRNGNFESDADWIISASTNWQIVDGKAVSDGGSGSFRQESLFTVGKVYSVTITVSDYVGGTLKVGVGSGPRYSITGNGTYTFTETAQPNVSFYILSTSFEGAVEKVSARETGQVEFVDNGGFYGVGNDTDVTTLSGWSIASSSYPATSTDIVGGKLVIVSSGIYQGAGYDLTGIPDGEEVNLKIGSVTGNNGNGALYLNGTGVDIPTESGSVDYTFIKQSVNTKLLFRAGFNTAGTTTYDDISIQPTNVFAYGWRRNLPNENGNGVKFEEGKLSLTDGFSKLIGDVKNTYLTTNTEFILKYDVLSAEGGEGFRVYSGVWLFPDVSIGSNEFRYINQVGSNGLFTGNYGSNGEITFDSMSLQEAKNQPKLIGISEVSTVSTPDNETVIISNRYTEGADQVTITYEPKEGFSRVDVKNYFQDRIIEAANSNNTVKVFDINPPVLIKDIISS